MINWKSLLNIHYRQSITTPNTLGASTTDEKDQKSLRKMGYRSKKRVHRKGNTNGSLTKGKDKRNAN